MYECPESELSGIGYKDFMRAVWYRKTVTLSEEQLRGRVLLHFGAVDYECRVWVNGQLAGTHKGGYSSFYFDVTRLVKEGENNLSVYAGDDPRSGRQPRGKQSTVYDSHDCDYTRTTGIWQTVWLEFVPRDYIESVRYYPNIEDGTMTILAVTKGDGVLSAQVYYEGESCGSAQAAVCAGNAVLTIALTKLKLWEPGNGRLYDLELYFGEDCAHSYFGMREVKIEGEKFLINKKACSRDWFWIRDFIQMEFILRQQKKQ